VWEVDRFRWPETIDELSRRERDYFQHAGQKLLEASQQGLRVLVCTAARPGEGCTTLALCLGRAVAAAGGRVALLDADMRHPHVASQLSLSFAHGWQDCLAGKLPWAEVAVTSLEDRLTVLPARTSNPKDGAAAELGTSPELLRQISSAFDITIVDLGPLAATAPRILGRGAQCAASAAIVVRDVRQTSEESTLIVVARLRMLGLQAVGIAENFGRVHRASVAA
jgi:Mrp family chromosome partitioning ATPase